MDMSREHEQVDAELGRIDTEARKIVERVSYAMIQ
jgi:hypothetical protein